MRAGGDGVSANEASWDRIARVILGVVMVGLGVGVVGGTWGWVLAVVGLVPLVTGLVGWCPIYSIIGRGTKEAEHTPTTV